jgi:meso-butanediol dehydrogenase / (S,S)-butanediol dehydrogenase / diacetyl reductase
MRLAEKVCVVTGSASGIGEACAKTYAREGGKVVIADRDLDGARRVAGEIRQAGGIAEAFGVNVAKPDELEAMVKFAIDKFGRLDVLHNNAMYSVFGQHTADIDLRGWQLTLNVSLTAYWYGIKVAISEAMLPQGKGSIINTASTAGLTGDYLQCAYNVAKAGVINLTRVTAIEYARKGIRCNAICPGPTLTPGIKLGIERGLSDPKMLVEGVPMGRLASTQEMANVGLFLASDESSFVTGTTIVADGGLSAASGMRYAPGHGPEW